MENPAFHSLLGWTMILLPILTTSLIHLPSKRLGECTFWTWEWKGPTPPTFGSEQDGSRGQSYWSVQERVWLTLTVRELVRLELKQQDTVGPRPLVVERELSPGPLALDGYPVENCQVISGDRSVESARNAVVQTMKEANISYVNGDRHN